jgi:hypothetical protein
VSGAVVVTGEELDRMTEPEVPLGVLAAPGRDDPLREAAPGDGEDAEPLRCVSLQDGEDIAAVVVGDRYMIDDARDRCRSCEHLLRRPLPRSDPPRSGAGRNELTRVHEVPLSLRTAACRGR